MSLFFSKASRLSLSSSLAFFSCNSYKELIYFFRVSSDFSFFSSFSDFFTLSSVISAYCMAITFSSSSVFLISSFSFALYSVNFFDSSSFLLGNSFSYKRILVCCSSIFC